MTEDIFGLLGYNIIATTISGVFIDDYDDKRLEEMKEAYGKHFWILEDGEKDTTTWRLSLISNTCSGS